MVEDFWRAYILFLRDLQIKYPRASPHDLKGESAEFSRRYWERFEAMAALMTPEQGQAFMRMIDEEDTVCSQEHHFHPERFYDRLGLSRPARMVGPGRERDAFYRKHGLDPATVDAFMGGVPPAAPSAPMRRPLGLSYPLPVNR